MIQSAPPRPCSTVKSSIFGHAPEVVATISTGAQREDRWL